MEDGAEHFDRSPSRKSFVCCNQIFSACLLATTYGNHTFASLRSIQLRILAPSHLLSDSLEREIARVVYTRVRNTGYYWVVMVLLLLMLVGSFG